MRIDMTEKLYLKDSYQLSCDSEILDIIIDNNECYLIFDKTPFFPGGGGQLSDKGSVNEYIIAEAFEKNGIVYHRLSNNTCALSIGDIVNVSVDKELRFERMRAHTGEHIVSGIAHKLFDVDNVGFHMDENALMTVDFNRYLDKSQLTELEFKANRCVMQDLSIISEIYSVAEAENLDYRSKLEFETDVRIVEIEDTDKCACCAPHLNSTGQVGSIKILSSASHRGGVRITLICGETAFLEFEKRYNQVLKISSLLCSEYDKADTAVDELIEANKRIKYEKDLQNNRFLEYVSKKIDSKDIITEFFDNFSLDELRIINNNLNSKCRISFLFSGNDSSGYNYSIMSENLQLLVLVKDLNFSLNGRGGGRGSLVQGKISADADKIIEFINEMKVEKYENA